MIPLWILGGGGHAKVVIDAARSCGQFDVMGVLDDAWSGGAGSVFGVAIRGTITESSLQTFGVTHAVIAIGSNSVRARLAERFSGMVTWQAVLHRTAYIAPDVTIGSGTVVCAGAVIQPGVTIGEHVIVNTSATVDHDSLLGDYVHVAPGSNLAGGSVVERGAFMGIGSCMIPNTTVGEWAIVGAGSVVIHDVPAGCTAVGDPAHVLTLEGHH